MKKKEQIAALKQQLNEITALNANNVQTMAQQEDQIRELEADQKNRRKLQAEYQDYVESLRHPLEHLRTATNTPFGLTHGAAAAIDNAADIIKILEGEKLNYRTNLIKAREKIKELEVAPEAASMINQLSAQLHSANTTLKEHNISAARKISDARRETAKAYGEFKAMRDRLLEKDAELFTLNREYKALQFAERTKHVQSIFSHK